MKGEVFYSFSYQNKGVLLKRKYARGEFADGVLIDGFKTAMSEFVKYAKSVGVDCD